NLLPALGLHRWSPVEVAWILARSSEGLFTGTRRFNSSVSYALFSCRTSQIRITAPTNDTIMEPVKPEADSPNKPNTKRPIPPPTLPSPMSIGTPYPPPFMTFPASHPAIKPTMTAQINPLSISSSFRLHCATCGNNADGCTVGPPSTQKPRATRVYEEDRLS